MASRFTMLFQMTTAPEDRAAAGPRTSGWSESFWSPGTVAVDDPSLKRLYDKRRLLLPKDASIVGWRMAIYDLVGNKIIPKSSSTGKLNKPGRDYIECDQPQVGLELSLVGQGQPNSSKIVLRGIPDGQVKNGEYQPDPAFKGFVTSYCEEIADHGWSFLGRDLSLPSVQVLSMANGTVTTNAAIGIVVNESFVRFSRTYDDAGNLIKGVYLVTGQAGFVYTLQGLGNVTKTKPGGRVRCDQVALINIAEVIPVKSVVRKVGRPFNAYRGRASKR